MTHKARHAVKRINELNNFIRSAAASFAILLEIV